MQKSEIIGIMEKSGAFEVKSGSVTLHFDEKGALKKITRGDNLYDERFDENKK